jgi:hypothetical protein
MDKKFLFLSTTFVLSFMLFISMMVFNKPLSRLTRAKEEFLPSAQTSLILAWPLTVIADGKTPVNINVFIRNNKNVPLSNKRVTLNSTIGEIKEIQSVTDKAGKANFVLTSSNPGVAEVDAIVDNSVKLEQKITIKFEK